MIDFQGLPDGKYRITELSTLSGYNKLASSIEIDLPYAIPDRDGYYIKEMDNKNGEPPYVTADGRYRDITMQITNTKLFELPLTGISEFNPWRLIIGAILVLVGTGTFCYASKKKKKPARSTTK